MIKKIKDKMFYYAVERNPHILQEYQQYRWNNEELHRKHRLKSWLYLGNLNFKHRLLKIPSEVTLHKLPEKRVRLPYLQGAESNLLKRKPPHIFARDLLSYDVISFDIFDTLVLRPLDDPRALFMILGEKHNYLDFSNIRINAEVQARDNAAVLKGNREVTIFDIYEIIEKRTGINKDYGVQIELETEIDLCFANPYMLRVFNILRAQGKRIIATSDMYLHESMIRKILNKCGYIGFEEVFVSCDYNCSKRDTNLYKIALKKIGDFNKVVHIGDNYVPDIESAQKVGIDAIYYKNVNDAGRQYRTEGMSDLVGSAYAGIVNAHLHNGIKEYDPYYEYGFIYGGLYVFGYCNWIHEYVKKNKVDKVLFLSRDGDIYQKVFNNLFNDVPNEYVFWSRIANTKYTADVNRDDFLTRMITHKAINVIDITVEDLLKSLNLSTLEKRLLDFGLRKEEIINKGNVKQLENLLIENWDVVIERYMGENEVLEDYFINVIGESKKVAVIDVGWLGTGAMGIKHLVEEKWKMNCEVKSLVAASASWSRAANINELMKNQTETYMFSRFYNRELFDSHLNTNKNTNNVYFELFTQACYPSFAGFDVNSNFEFDIPEVENYDVIKKIHQGIMDFSTMYNEFFENHSYMYNIPGYDAYLPFRMVTRNVEFFRRFFSETAFSRGVGADYTNQRTETIGDILNKVNL